MHLGAVITKKKSKVCEDKISALSDDLLVQILSQIPTKDAVTTMILSKRWRFVWTMLYNLDYENTNIEEKSSVWEFLEKSLELHKAPVLESLRIKLGKRHIIDGDAGKCVSHVGKCVSHAVERSIRKLNVECLRLDMKSLPKSLYTCKTLVKLTLWSPILVDVSSTPCLPSLQTLDLKYVVYKDEDSQVRLLSSCPVLKDLVVLRGRSSDNVTRFSVKVPSLQKLAYTSLGSHDDRSLVIDSPGLKKVIFKSGGNCSSQNILGLVVAIVNYHASSFRSHPKFLTSFSSVMFLDLEWTDVAFCSSVNFSRLIELKLSPHYFDSHWLESLVHVLNNSPKLRVLMIHSVHHSKLFSRNQPICIRGCLLSHLEILEWDVYGGGRQEKQLLAYILANSKCLKTVGITERSFVIEKEQMMKEELESMYRVSASSQLIYSVQMRWRSYRE